MAEPPAQDAPALRELERQLAEAGSLPRFELKAKRLLDEREVWGGHGERKAM